MAELSALELLYERIVEADEKDIWRVSRNETEIEQLVRDVRFELRKQIDAAEDTPAPGTLIVGHDPERNEVVVNHPEIRPNAKGAGYIGFSAAEARHLAELLIKNAERCEQAEQRSTNEG